uniref:Uncharacterized protein n=1 Tax=Rhizophagus irregularis (strain DAOM 181602 / DAOM 197198 / MUCL 43194) TaxID=747089 RepID=U9SS36_RHIID
MQDTENANEWIKWIEEVDSDKKYFKFYEYKQFNNIQHVEVICELKIQQEVDFHDIATE